MTTRYARAKPILPAAALVLGIVLAGCLVGERPAAPDADGDGLPDAAEAQGWTISTIYDVVPCDAPPDYVRETTVYNVTSNVYLDDNDTDGLRDSLEFAFHTDPNKADTDEDGLTDKEEWDLRHDPDVYFNVAVIKGRDADSDLDCLGDYQEVAEGYENERLGRRVFSDPTSPDGDRDGWTDLEEIQTHLTDPMDPDTDADGAQDSLDLDPHVDIAIHFRFTEVRIDRESTGFAKTDGIAADIRFAADDPFPVAQGTWSEVPESASLGTADIDDRSPGTNVTITMHWLEVDSNGDFVDFLALAPATDAKLRVDVADGSWSVQQADGTYGDPGNACELAGADGAFRFDLKVGDANEDPGGWDVGCDQG